MTDEKPTYEDLENQIEFLKKELTGYTKTIFEGVNFSNEIDFHDLFDINEIQKIQDLFAESNGVASIITYPNGVPITKPSNFCRLCIDIIRKTEKGLKNCYYSDAVIGKQNIGGAIYQPCLSGGLWDGGASISVGGKHIANWLIGQVKNDNLDEHKMLLYAKEIGADEIEFKKALDEVSVMSTEKFKKIADTLFLFANEISQKAYQNILQKRLIVELKKKEEQLIHAKEETEESGRTFKKLFEDSADAILLINSKGLFVECNQAALNLLKMTREQFIFKPPVEISPEYQPNGRKSDEAAIEMIELAYKKGLHRFDWTCINAEGGQFIVEVSLMPIIVKGQTMLHTTWRDITERKLSEIELKKAKEKIEESENLYRKMNENSPLGMHFYKLEDNQLIFTGYNPAADRLLKVDNSQFVGKTIEHAFPPLALTDIPCRYRDAAEKGISWTTEQINYDDKKIVGAFEVRAFQTTPGNMVAIFDDITIRKQAEQAINEAKEKSEESESKWLSLTNNTNDTIVLSDVNFIIQDVNKTIFPTTKKDVIGTSVYKYIVEEYHAIMQQTFENVIRTKLPGEYETKLNMSEINPELPPMWFVTKITPLIQNSEIVGFILIATDITHRKNTEIELIKAKEKAEESENLIKNITDNIPAFIAVVDVDTLKYKFVNKKFTEGFNKSKQEIVGRHISEIIGEANTNFAMSHINEVRQGKPSSYVNTFNLAQGTRYANVNYVPGFNENGELKNIIVLTLDITEIKETEIEIRKAKEKAEESDRLKTAFLQNMSHEIRTPMNAIIGFSEFIDDPDLSIEKRKSFTSIIKNSAYQLLSIITDILSISAIETKQEKVSIEMVCINNIIIDLLSIFKSQAFSQNISLYAKPQLTDKQSEIYTDKTKVTQILTNLLTNALKFTHEGFIEFGYCLRTDLEPVLMEFYVKDSGIGIKAEMQEKIFERFRQANENISRKYGGTGLGLAISKAFTELLGGSIWVQSELDKGSTFYFTIPYKPVHEDENLATPRKKTDIKKVTILIAEDEEYNFLFLQEVLNKSEINIIHTKDGGETVELCKNNPDIALILMDIKMPVLDGYSAAKQIKQFRPDIPIIAQSAYALVQEREKYKGNAFDEYITKPIDKNKLKQLVEKYILANRP